MYWKRRGFKYDILIPPISKPFAELSPMEAEDYFKWYVSQLECRTMYLQNYSGVTLNYSVKSLKDIWGWFIKHAEVEKTTKTKLDEIKSQLANYPKEIADTVLEEQSKQFSLETEYIIRDIAMYFGEVCVKNNSSISWGYHTDIKADSFANMPLLVGFEDRDFSPPFKAHFEPTFIVRGLACNILDGDQKKEDLFDMYRKWQRMF